MEFVGVEDMWIERPACPFHQVFVFGMGWIADCAEDVFVSREAADIFGRASAGYLDKLWIEVAGCRIADGDGFDQMAPVISEVANIADRDFSSGVDDVTDADFGHWQGVGAEVSVPKSGPGNPQRISPAMNS